MQQIWVSLPENLRLVAVASGTSSVVSGALAFLQKHASAIGVLFTAATFLIFAISSIFGMWIAYREHRLRMRNLKAGIPTPPPLPKGKR